MIFFSAVAAEYAWRRKEMTVMKFEAASASEKKRSALMKSAMLIFYSHWEGFVKQSFFFLCQLINSKKLPASRLKSSFSVFRIFDEVGDGKLGNFDNCLRLISALENDVVFSLNYKKHISTKSNLNSEVFSDLMRKFDVSVSQIDLKFKALDEVVLNYRNAIAHGEYRDVDEPDFENFCLVVVSLIDGFKTHLENYVATKGYLAGG